MQIQTPVPAIDLLLQTLVERARGILRQRYLGAYLYGSLVTGDFNPSTSDIDFMILTSELPSSEQIQALESLHQKLWIAGDKWAEKLEGAYVPEDVIRRHVAHASPVPAVNEGRFYLAPLGSDWLFQRAVLRRPEARLDGPDLSKIIAPVQRQQLQAALREVLIGWWQPFLDHHERLDRPGYQPFAVFSMCRALHFSATGEIASKVASAQWALAELPVEWHSLIRQALVWQPQEPTGSKIHTLEFIAFALTSLNI